MPLKVSGERTAEAIPDSKLALVPDAPRNLDVTHAQTFNSETAGVPARRSAQIIEGDQPPTATVSCPPRGRTAAAMSKGLTGRYQPRSQRPTDLQLRSTRPAVCDHKIEAPKR